MKALFNGICALLMLLSLSCFAEQTVRIGTWNMEWLDGGASPKGPSRSDEDYEKMGAMFKSADLDVMAFEEVGTKSALKKVIGSDFNIEMSTRATEPPDEGEWIQYTGFAIRKGITYKRHADVSMDVNNNNSMRNGVDITLYQDGKAYLRLLAVHLKSSCFYQSETYSSSCKTLEKQAVILHEWVKSREEEHVPFAVMGDFNRRMADNTNHWFLDELEGVDDDYVQLYLATQGRHSNCWSKSTSSSGKVTMHQYTQYIDHIVFNDLAQPSGLSSSFKQTTVSKAQAKAYNLSDHCPISIEYEPY